MIKSTLLPHKFVPRVYQGELFNKIFVENYLRLITVEHRRAGKDKGCLNITVAKAMQKVGTYFYSFPKLSQARRVMWIGIDKEGMRYLDHIPPWLIANINKKDMTIELINGSIIIFVGSDNYNTSMGSNPIGIVFSEFSLQNPKAWPHFSPILDENGGWAIFNYTPRGRNHGYDLYNTNLDNPEWFVRKLTVEDTERSPGVPVVSQEAIEKARRSGFSEAMIQQEFYCSFDTSLPGAYYEREMSDAFLQGRVIDFEFDPNIPVYTFWDLGYTDATAIWFMQPKGHDLMMINYYENVNLSMAHYIEYIFQYAKDNNIIYADHYAPHDVKNHEWTTGKTRRIAAMEQGINFRDVPNVGRLDGINAAKAIFDRVHFHNTFCKLGLIALQSYHREFDTANKIYKNDPKHDHSSNGADSFRYFAVAWDDYYANNKQIFNNNFSYDNFIV